MNEIPKCDPVQMKAVEKYFPVVLFMILHKMALTFVPVDEILKCGRSNGSHCGVFPCSTVGYAVQSASTL